VLQSLKFALFPVVLLYWVIALAATIKTNKRLDPKSNPAKTKRSN
jgi:hypothetical protein